MEQGEQDLAPERAGGAIRGMLTMLALVVSRTRFVALCALAGGVVALALTFAFPARYRAEATFLPSRQFAEGGQVMDTAGLASAARQFGLGLVGEGMGLTDLFPQLVASRRLLAELANMEFADRHGRSHSLREHLGFGAGVAEGERVIRLLRKHGPTSSEDVRSGLCKVSVSLSDPVLAGHVANACVALLDRISREELTSSARRQVAFVEGRVTEVGGQLIAAEDSLSDFHESNRMISGAPELMAVERRLNRNVQLYEQLYITLRQQLELARIDEVKNLPVITIIDAAVPPQRRQGPGRVILAITGAILATCCAVGWIAYGYVNPRR